jgi:hypothetical protein
MLNEGIGFPGQKPQSPLPLNNPNGFADGDCVLGQSESIASITSLDRSHPSVLAGTVAATGETFIPFLRSLRSFAAILCGRQRAGTQSLPSTGADGKSSVTALPITHEKKSRYPR